MNPPSPPPPPPFDWFNFLNNVTNLGSIDPSNPNALGDFLTHATGGTMAFNIVRNVNNSLSTANSNPPEEQLPPSRIATAHSNNLPAAETTKPPPPSKDDDVCSLDESFRDSNLGKPVENDVQDIPHVVTGDKNICDSEDIPDENTVDDQSFKSCRTNPMDDSMYDHSDQERFPQGVVCYHINQKDFKPSWCFMTYGNKSQKGHSKITYSKKFYQSCLGYYRCPVNECKLTCNPASPRKARKKFADPDKPIGDGLCSVHNEKVVHVPCRAECVLTVTDNSVLVEHKGTHQHPRPDEKVSDAGREKLASVRKAHKDATPYQILIGEEGRDPAIKMHPKLNNLGTLRYELQKQKKGDKPGFELKSLKKWEKEHGVKFVLEASLDKGAIVMQVEAMKDISKDNSMYAFQTDSLEG